MSPLLLAAIFFVVATSWTAANAFSGAERSLGRGFTLVMTLPLYGMSYVIMLCEAFGAYGGDTATEVSQGAVIAVLAISAVLSVITTRLVSRACRSMMSADDRQ